MSKSLQSIEFKLITAAANKALDLAEVKAYLKISNDLEDDLLDCLIDSATTVFENKTGRDLINKTYKSYLDNFPCNNLLAPLVYPYNRYYGCYYTIQLPKSRVSVINSIQYFLDNSLTVWDSSNYILLEEPTLGEIGLAQDKHYPTEIDCKKQAVEIEFIAGYGADSSSIPADIKVALLSYIAFLYENRGDCADAAKFPLQFKAVCELYKIWLI